MAILAVGACIGAFYIGKWYGKTKQEPTEGNTTYKVQYLQESYVQGEFIVFEITATSDVKFTALSISVDNEEEQELIVKTGESKDLEKDEKAGNGKYFIKSEVKTIVTRAGEDMVRAIQHLLQRSGNRTLFT